MKLQTQIPIARQNHNQIDYNSKLLLLGSCFSHNIFDKLQHSKFQAFTNPLGIQFHVIGLERLVTRAINQNYFTKDELCNVEDTFYSYDAHSKWNSVNPEDLCEELNNQLDITLSWISSASHIIITLGTSWVYRHIARDCIVSNCHKIPQKQFLKELLSTDDVSESLDSITALVRSINPEVSFVFTVSPIRHLKDGLVENNRSKAHLLTAIHRIVDPRQKNFYFPSYEIQMDELRDYRFYERDMLHPSQQAIDIIWEYFVQSWVSEEAKAIKAKVEEIQKGLSHRPFNPNSESFKDFRVNLNSKIKELRSKYPQIEF